MQDGGMDFLLRYIEEHPFISNILEVGTAVGLSSIQMAGVRNTITIDTIEANLNMVTEAKENIQTAGLSDRIFVHHADGALWKMTKYYDLFFIDAAKSQYRMYLEHFFENSYKGSVFVFDNMNFHGIVDNEGLSQNRSTIQMVHKIKKFRDFILRDSRFSSEYYSTIGDGIIVAERVV